MTKRRALWLVVTVVVLAAFSLLVPASPAYLPDLVTRGYFGYYHDGHSAGYWTKELTNPDVEVRHHAISALGAMGTDASDSIPALSTVLVEDPDREARSMAALALSKMAPASRRAVPALARALGDEEPFVRMNSATALFQLRTGARGAVPALIKAFQDESNNRHLPLFFVSIQEMMALTLGRASAGSVEGVPVLKEALEAAQTARSRWVLARALGEVGHEARPAAPQLRVLLTDRDRFVRDAAEDALRKMGESPAADPQDPAEGQPD
jgi:HEAT repeat protein